MPIMTGRPMQGLLVCSALSQKVLQKGLMVLGIAILQKQGHGFEWQATSQ